MEVKELIRLKAELESTMLNLLRDFSRFHEVSIDDIRMSSLKRMTMGGNQETIIQEVKIGIRL